MAMFEKLRDKSLNLAEAGVNKAKEVGEIAKLNLAIAAEEENIRKAYTEIGRLYYAATGASSPDPVYTQYFAKIGECKAKIELSKAKIAEVKADDKEEYKGTIHTTEAADAFIPPDTTPGGDYPPEESVNIDV